MKWPVLRRSVLVCALLAVGTASAEAQQPWFGDESDEAVRTDLEVMYIRAGFASVAPKGVKVSWVAPPFKYFGPAPNPPKKTVGSMLFQAPAAASSHARTFELAPVAELAITRDDGSGVIQLGGGLRLTTGLNPRLGVFGEVVVGLTHFPGENSFTLWPRGGVLIPVMNDRFMVVGTIGVPIISFPGIRETGFELAGGVVLPIRR